MRVGWSMHVSQVPGAEAGQQTHHLLPLLGVIKQPPLSPETQHKSSSGARSSLLYLAGTLPALSHSQVQMLPGDVILTLRPLSCRLL